MENIQTNLKENISHRQKWSLWVKRSISVSSMKWHILKSSIKKYDEKVCETLIMSQLPKTTYTILKSLIPS